MAEAAARPRSPWVVLLAAAIGLAVTASAGFWQLRRAAGKEGLQQALQAHLAMPPLRQDELARAGAQALEQHYRHVRLKGRWLAAHTIYLDNRQMDGRPGFYVLTPLLLDGGGQGDAVLVQRGWAPRDLRDRSLVPAVPTPTAQVTVEGQVAAPPARLFDFGGEQAGAIRQNLDLGAYARETGLALRPLSILQTAGADDGLQRRWPAPAVDVQKHYGYAFQWFGMAGLIAGLYVWFQLLKPRLRRPAAPDLS